MEGPTVLADDEDVGRVFIPKAKKISPVYSRLDVGVFGHEGE
jgi:hypothetical protein